MRNLSKLNSFTNVFIHFVAENNFFQISSTVKWFLNFFIILTFFLSAPLTSFFQELLEVVPPPEIADEDEIASSNNRNTQENISSL